MIRYMPGLGMPVGARVAFSGGVDSLAVAHFLKTGHKRPTLLHFNHGCQYSDGIEEQCRDKADELDLPIIVGKIGDPTPPKGISLEEHWRNERYKFFSTQFKQKMVWFAPDKKLVPLQSSIDDHEYVITAHHLNDAVETWLWSSFHGEGKLISVFKSPNVLRPFLLTPKREFEKYCKKHGLTPVDDPYNRELSLTRNLIRSKIIPLVEQVNPGIEKVIKKKYLKG